MQGIKYKVLILSEIGICLKQEALGKILLDVCFTR